MRYAPFALAFMLVGCAPVTWDRPNTTQVQFNQDNARCRLVAQGMNSGDFFAVGSASYVAGAAIGNAIGTAMKQYATHKDCMMATGYTPQDPQAQANAGRIKPISAQSTACMSAIYTDPQAEPIRRHAPFNAREATPDQLADRTMASPQDIAAIDYLHPRAQACQKQAIDALAGTMPGAAAALTTAYARGEGDISLLRDRRMTWGDFTTRRRDRAVELQATLNAELAKAPGS